jgi:hypothetical protein
MWRVANKSLTVAIIDSQSKESAEKGRPASIRLAMTRARGATFSPMHSAPCCHHHPADDRDGDILPLATPLRRPATPSCINQSPRPERIENEVS